MAVVPPSRGRVSAEVVLLDGIIEVPRDEEVEEPVAVEVGKCRRGRPTRPRDARLIGHVGEGPVAVVVIENVTVEVRDVEIDIPVIVVVGRDGSHPVRCVFQSSLLGHVGERAVAVVAVEAILSAGAAVGWKRARLDDVEVHPAIVVVIEPGHARSHRLGKLVCRRRPAVVQELQARPGRDIGEHDRAAGVPGRFLRRNRRESRVTRQAGQRGQPKTARALPHGAFDLSRSRFRS